MRNVLFWPALLWTTLILQYLVCEAAWGGWREWDSVRDCFGWPLRCARIVAESFWELAHGARRRG